MSQTPLLTFTRPEKEFLSEIKAEAHNVIKHKKEGRFAGKYIFFKGLLFLTCSLVFYALMLDTPSPWHSLALGVLTYLSVLFFALNVGHDAAHDSLTPFPRLNRLVLDVTFNVLGVNAYLWKLRHRQSHHVFPNVAGCDADIDHNPVLRFSPDHPMRWYFRYQHIYAWFVYFFVTLHSVFIQDYFYIRKKELANLRNIRHPAREVVLFTFWKALYLLIFIIIPWHLKDISFLSVMTGWIIAAGIASYFFVLPLIGTHFSDYALVPESAQSKDFPHSWVYHQIATSVDWSPQNKLSLFFYGGLNCHVAHHLFPHYAHHHYPQLTELLQSKMTKYQLPYHCVSLPEIIVSHYRFLRKMGRESSPSHA